MVIRPRKGTLVGCGYVIEVVGSNKVRIHPSGNFSKCNLTIGLGNAIFVIDPKRPPDTIRKIIDGDASGDFAPNIDMNKKRFSVRFSRYENSTQTFTDKNGDTYEVKIPILKDYRELHPTNPVVVSRGYYSRSKTESFGGFLDRWDVSKFFSGIIPYNAGGNEISQISSRGLRYLCYIKDGGDTSLLYVFIRGKKIPNGTSTTTGTLLTIDMGSEFEDGYKDVLEFTYTKNETPGVLISFIIKGVNGTARNVYVKADGTLVYDAIVTGVYKVAGGRMLEPVDILYCVTDTKKYIPILKDVYDNNFSNSCIDCTSYGVLVSYEIQKLESFHNKHYRYVELKTNGELVDYKGNVIDTGVLQAQLLRNGYSPHLMVGKEGKWNEVVKSVYRKVWSFYGISGMADRYDAWADSTTKPACEWVGVGSSRSSTSWDSVPCVTTTGLLGTNTYNGGFSGIVYLKENGELKFLKDDGTTENAVRAKLNGNLFDELYVKGTGHRFVACYEDNESYNDTFMFETEGETSNFCFFSKAL